MIYEDNLMAVEQAEVGWDELKVSPAANPPKHVRLDDSLEKDGWFVIWAHAPAKIKLVVKKAVLLRPALSTSARYSQLDPIHFWVSHNFLGMLSIPGTAGRSMELLPGKYEIVIECQNKESAHSFMMVKER